MLTKDLLELKINQTIEYINNNDFETLKAALKLLQQNVNEIIDNNINNEISIENYKRFANVSFGFIRDVVNITSKIIDGQYVFNDELKKEIILLMYCADYLYSFTSYDFLYTNYDKFKDSVKLRYIGVYSRSLKKYIKFGEDNFPENLNKLCEP
jgi:hypothetical protein